jgi:hypothetical protein
MLRARRDRSEYPVAQNCEPDRSLVPTVDLMTLYSEEPTLASVAYLSTIGPVAPSTPGQNPGAYDCATGSAGPGRSATRRPAVAGSTPASRCSR